jgi:hypothetical protein
VSRGLAGAALFAVPVAVAALIGFGTSLSGVAGGLTAVTSGPDAVPASATTPNKLNHAVAALANKPAAATQANSGNSNGQAGTPDNGVSVEGAPTGSGGSGSSPSPSVDVSPSGATSTTPGVTLPDTGGVTDTTTTTTNNAVDQVNGAVNNLLGGVTQTLNNLLGK